MHVSKRDRSFLRPDKRSMGSVKISQAFAFAMKDVIGVKEVLDTDKATAYKQQDGKKYGNSKGHYKHG